MACSNASPAALIVRSIASSSWAKDGEQPRDARHLDGKVSGCSTEARGEPGRGGLDPDVRRAVELAQGREARRDGEGIPRKRPRLVDVAGGRDPLHQVAPSTVGGRRQPAADHLAHHGQVGLDPEQLLGAAARHPEAADHLVEDQQ